MPQTPVLVDTRHRFLVADDRRATHLRLDVYPDGGLTRLRCFGEISEAARAEMWERFQAKLPDDHRRQLSDAVLKGSTMAVRVGSDRRRHHGRRPRADAEPLGTRCGGVADRRCRPRPRLHLRRSARCPRRRRPGRADHRRRRGRRRHRVPRCDPSRPAPPVRGRRTNRSCARNPLPRLRCGHHRGGAIWPTGRAGQPRLHAPLRPRLRRPQASDHRRSVRSSAPAPQHGTWGELRHRAARRRAVSPTPPSTTSTSCPGCSTRRSPR